MTDAVLAVAAADVSAAAAAAAAAAICACGRFFGNICVCESILIRCASSADKPGFCSSTTPACCWFACCSLVCPVAPALAASSLLPLPVFVRFAVLPPGER